MNTEPDDTTLVRELTQMIAGIALCLKQSAADGKGMAAIRQMAEAAALVIAEQGHEPALDKAEETPGLMDEDTLYALEMLYDEYAPAEYKNWEEQGQTNRHIWPIWERLGIFITKEKARRGLSDVSP